MYCFGSSSRKLAWSLKSLVQLDKTNELYLKLRKDKARNREVKNTTARRPFWKRDWRK